MKRRMFVLAAALAVAAAVSASAFGYASPIDSCQHSPTPQLCAGGAGH